MIQINKFNNLSPTLLTEIVSLDEQIFDNPYPIEKIQKKALDNNPLTLIAYDKGKPVGFEIVDTYQVPGETIRIVLEKDL